MKIFKYFIIIIFIMNLNFSYAQEKDLQNKITKNLRCLICQGQSVYDSDSEFANSLKILVEKKLNQGLAEEEIYHYLESKYGEWILFDPNFNKNTYFLWLLPILMFIIPPAIMNINIFSIIPPAILMFIIAGGIILKIFILKKN